MKQVHKSLMIAIVAVLGLWGCAQSTSNPSAGNKDERIKSLEAKVARLEKEINKLGSERDEAQQKIAELEKENGQLARQLEASQAVAKERDQLKADLAARTGERDAINVQFEELRKGIRTLLGKAEAGTPSAPAPSSTTSAEDPPQL